MGFIGTPSRASRGLWSGRGRHPGFPCLRMRGPGPTNLGRGAQPLPLSIFCLRWHSHTHAMRGDHRIRCLHELAVQPALHAACSGQGLAPQSLGPPTPRLPAEHYYSQKCSKMTVHYHGSKQYGCSNCRRGHLNSTPAWGLRSAFIIAPCPGHGAPPLKNWTPAKQPGMSSGPPPVQPAPNVICTINFYFALVAT